MCALCACAQSAPTHVFFQACKIIDKPHVYKYDMCMIHVMKDIVNTCTVTCMLLVSNVAYVDIYMDRCIEHHCTNFQAAATTRGCQHVKEPIASKNYKEFAAPITGEWPSDTSASVEECLATWKSVQNPDSIIIFIVKSQILTSHVMILSIAICIYVYLNISIYIYIYIYIFIFAYLNSPWNTLHDHPTSYLDPCPTDEHMLPCR